MPNVLAQFVVPELPLLAAGGLAVTAVPIVIHMLTRLRRRPVAWGAMRFLLEAYRRHRSRLRIEQWLLLLVRCLILAILGLALSGPGLTGCASSGAPWTGRSRLVVIVLDDSLTTQIADLDGRRRFDQLRDQAVEFVDALGPTDRVALWRTAGPIIEPVGQGTLDHQQVRRELESIEPRYSRSDVAQALTSIHSKLSEDGAPDADRVFVIVLSDWAHDALDVHRSPPAPVTALAGQCRLLISRPAPSADNVQVQTAAPRRFMLLVEPTGQLTTMPVTLTLRRFVDHAGTAESIVRLTPLDPQTHQPMADPTTRIHRWATGQHQATLNIELPLALDASADQTPDDRTQLIVSIQIESPSVNDPIAADNQRWLIAELRRQLRVGVLDRLGTAVHADQTLSPRQWLTFALMPLPGTGHFDVMDVDASAGPSALDESLEHVDAMMVLRPDLVADAGWQVLGRFAHGGGVVWVFMPPDPAPAVWAAALQRDFGLSWQLALEPRGLDREPLNLVADAMAPELLDILAADWPGLIKPIRVYQRFDLTVSDGDQHLWLTAAEDQAAAPLLAAAPVGAGHFMLLATALDPDWTNLPTKPLFVPLMHESLRSILGAANPAARYSKVHSGDSPVLGETFDGAETLAHQDRRIPLQLTDAGLVPVVPLVTPGIYAALPGGRQHLAVNVDAHAGDSRALDEDVLVRWTDWHLLDANDPTSVLAEPSQIVRLGWPLLWVVLALVVIETGMARWFSHAAVAPQRPTPRSGNVSVNK